MADSLEHRGPDADGFYDDEYCGLAFRRLSIIDLSKKANQPLINKEHTLVLVFNGEIYNFKSLRKELESKGYRFETQSDSEVILHGYAAYGESIVKRLRGMFAFALWDRMQKKLFVARDRLGKKPLFYYYDREKFVFGSEMKALLQDPNIKRTINTTALWHYLSYGYVPSPVSIFEGIAKLPPAHYLICTKAGVEIRRYWDIDVAPEYNTEQYFIDMIQKQLDEAVRLRMIADVPLGAFLSGGIDSSSVVALMARHTTEPIKTFSIGFEEGAFDETRYARMVAERYHTDHKEFTVKEDAVKILPKLIWHYDEPYADSSALPSYYLSQMTRKYVTVALNGDGGDENFAGYNRYAIATLLNKWGKLPKALTTPAAFLVNSLPETLHPFVRRARRFVHISTMQKQDSYIELMQIFNHQAKQALCAGQFQDQSTSNILLQKEFTRCKDKNFLNKMLSVDIKTYLPEDLLVKMDRATMANSLEARSPYLDHVFMEFAATIPPELKLKGITKKYILKKALQPYLPRKILQRQKMGFGVPLGAWFRGELAELAAQVLLSRQATRRGYFRRDKIDDLLSQHKKGRRDLSPQIWSLLWLELWHRMYIDSDVTKTGPVVKLF